LNHRGECFSIMNMYRITIFHYHLQTGGITQVIRDSVLAMLQEAPEQFEIKIVSGREEQTDEFISLLKKQLARNQIQARLTGEVFSMIGYTDSLETSPDSEAIKEALLSRYGGTIWWVHNYHIGKNPHFTRALIEIAQSHQNQHILFQIHDFPESGRFSNLKMIHAHAGPSLYPVYANIRYVVINSRDHDILIQAGLPSDNVFLLNNPVKTVDTGFTDFWQVHDKINRWAQDTQERWITGGKLILYPIRTIRRKNVLEAALFTNLLDTPANLLVTLPGSSNQEKHYSDLVALAYKEKLVPGAWAIGNYLEELQTSFSELTHAVDLILSSSIQEGFGYLFINSLLWSVPLVARDLDILDGIKSLYSPADSHFYSGIMVPLPEPERRTLQQDYLQAMTSLHGTLPEDILKGLHGEIEQMLRSDTIDYSFLSLELQYKHLRETAHSPDYRKILREMNAEAAGAAENLLLNAKSGDTKRVMSKFGPQAHTKQVLSILESFASTGPEQNPDQSTGKDIESNVLALFSHVKNFRLLFHAR